jgi:hypothetical protein
LGGEVRKVVYPVPIWKQMRACLVQAQSDVDYASLSGARVISCCELVMYLAGAVGWCSLYSCRVFRLQTEKHLSELVVSKAVAAKIDRPAGLVQFGARQVR